MPLQLQTRWVCRTCRKEWVPPGSWSPVNVFNPQTRRIEEWDGAHCVNPECWSTEIEPRSYIGERGFDVPRNPDGSFGGVIGTTLQGFGDALGQASERRPEPPPMDNPTLRLARGMDDHGVFESRPEWVPDGSPYDLSEMD